MLEAVLKMLSENDVGETKSHQAGFLIPKDFVKNGFFEELSRAELNPRVKLKFTDLTNGTDFYANYIYYNNRFHGGTRFEYRLTGLTRWIKNHGLRSGDVIKFVRTGRYDYSIDILKGERKPSTLSKDSWEALYGERHQDDR
jgi:hypothetical protein